MRIAVLSLCLLVAGSSAAQGMDTPRIRAVGVAIDRPMAGEEAQLTRYLEDLLGWAADERTAEEAVQRVLRLSRYASASCQVRSTNEGGELACEVTRARLIRNLRFEGLPAQILETDIRKRLFLRPGEPLARGQAADEERITRQRERLEDYLVREGFFGASVDIRTSTLPKTGDLEVVVAVSGGSFVSVREVEVTSWLPLSRGRVFDEYFNMCAGGDGWLGLFETWRLHCYTRSRLSETTERLEEELRESGYPEARISVESALVDASDPENGRCAWSEGELARFREQELPVPPRCVDLKVKVVPGRHLVTTLALHQEGRVEQRSYTSPFLEGWEWLSERVRNALFVEELSRALQLFSGSPVAAARDTRLRLRDLEAQLTFASSGALDDTEVELTRRSLLNHLASRGYLGAEVRATRTESGERVDVRFDIYPGRVTAVREVSLVGNRRFSDEELLENVTLASRPRSLLQGGFVTRQDIEDDVQRLFRFYEDRGYRDASISARASEQGEDLTVTFYVDEGEPYVLGGARFRGGDPALSLQVLAEIVHCKGGVATQQRRTPLTPKDCVGSPLRPEELAADSERVRAVYARAGFPYVDARVGLSPEWTDEGPILDIVVWQREDALEDNGLRDEPPTSAPPSPDDELERPVRVSRGEIFLEGNFRTERHAILNEMGLSSEGEPRLDPIAISEGISRLRRTGLFSRVDYDYIGREDRRRELDVVVQVEERKAGTVDFAAAYSTQDFLGQLRAEWRDRNLFGLMLDLGVRADYGLFIGRESRLEAPFRWPRIVGSNLSLRVEPSAIYSDHPSVVVPRDPASEGLVPSRAIFHALTRRRIFSVGGRVALDWVSPPNLIPGLSAGFEYELRAEWDDPAAEPIPLLASYSFGPLTLRLPSQRALETVDGLLTVFDQPLARVGVLTPRVRYSAIQNPFDPVSGWTGELSFSFGHPWLGDSTTTYLLQGRAAWYRPFAQNFVLALHGRGWGGVTDVMPGGRSFLLRPDLLSLGGDRTVRGYSATALNEQFGVPELAVDVAEGRRGGPIPLVGAVGNAEVRWTAVRNLFLGDLKLAGFVDAGFVTDDETLALESLLNPLEAALLLASENRAGVGVGAGIRYVLPVGPLSLDLAFAPITRNVQLHLQFGYVF